MPEATARKPAWIKTRAPGGENYARLKGLLRHEGLHTVCEAARCPNVGECWGAGTATLLLLGDVCTRGCRFCAVAKGDPGGVVDEGEPDRVARTVERLGLLYVVLTCVDRDDLLDGGADIFARTLRAIRARVPHARAEVLTGDFGGDRRAITTVLEARPHCFAHNIETVRRLTPRVRDRRCSYDRSLDVLRVAGRVDAAIPRKSSIMLGLGETDEEILEAMDDLREAGVERLTLGQYLRPTVRHTPVLRWVDPETFARLGEEGRRRGFRHVASGPLVRSSYHAEEADGEISAVLAAFLDRGAGVSHRGVPRSSDGAEP